VAERIPETISSTNRFRLIMLLAAFLLASSVVVGPPAAQSSILIIVLAAFMAGYAKLALSTVERLRVSASLRPAIEGEEVEVPIRIKNPTPIPVAFAEVSVLYSPYLHLERGAKSALIVVPPRGYAELRLVFRARVGSHRVGPLLITVRDPLGLFRSREIEIPLNAVLRVYPKVSEAEIRRLLAEARSVGITRSRRPGTGVEFHSLRDYRPGDDIRRIVWKYYASRMKLAVRETERESVQSILFIVDATQPMLSGPYGSTPLEHSLRVVASISAYLAARGDSMGLIVYDSRVLSMPKLARGKAGYRAVLEFISSFMYPDPGEAPLGEDERSIVLVRAARRAAEILPRERNAVFIFTAPGGGAYEESLARAVSALRSLGNEVYVVIPVLAAYEVKGLPEWSRPIFRLRTYEAVKKSLEFARRMRARGAHVIATGPELMPRIIAEIIERRQA